MIKKSKQSWEIGSTVKVGFLTLTVVAQRETPKDWKPDAYLLVRNKNYYEFVPHNGLSKLSAWEVKRDWNLEC